MADSPNASIKGRAVTAGRLRVILLNGGASYFAQGFEVDYGAQGRTDEEAVRAFIDGLAGTIDDHIQRFGHLRNLLAHQAPPDVWQRLNDMDATPEYREAPSIAPFDGLELYRERRPQE